MLGDGHTGNIPHRCELANQLGNLRKIKRTTCAEGRYDDVAYIEGYTNGLLYLPLDDKGRKAMPLLFQFRHAGNAHAE